MEYSEKPKVPYTQEATIIPAHDEKGHTVQLKLYVPPLFLKQLDILAKKFSYFNKGDVVRDAIVRLFTVAEKWDAIDNSRLARIYSTIAYINDDKEQQGYGVLLKEIRERIHLYLSKDATKEARRMYINAKKDIELLPPGYWKDLYIKTIETEYGWLESDLPRGVSLLNLVDEEDEYT